MLQAIYFISQNCVGCKLGIAAVRQVTQRHNVPLTLRSIDTTGGQRMALNHGVDSVPELVFLKDECFAGKLRGVNSAEKIEDMIIQLMED